MKIKYFLFLFSILIAFASCKKSTNNNAKTKEKKHYSADTTVVVNQSDEFDFSFSDTINYYSGTINKQHFIIKVNHADSNMITGYYFPITESNYTNPYPFELRYFNKNYQLVYNDNSVSLNFEVEIGEDFISGNYYIRGISHSKKHPIKLAILKQPPFKLYKSNRYKSSIFTVDIQKDITYGEAEGFWSSYPHKDERYITLLRNTSGKNKKEQMLDLKLDIYSPHGDSIAKHPLIVFLHGGGFYVGDKAELPIKSWCEHFTQLGYVTASINYRLGFKVSKSSIQRCGYKAIQDAHAALRFLVANADKYGIDTSEIFIAGTSAGSITGMSLLFMNNNNRPKTSYKKLFAKDLGSIDASGNKLHNSFKIKAIANMWGAVYDLTEIKYTPTPIISFHGTEDQLVPFDEGLPFSEINNLAGEILFDKMYGSAAIHRRLNELNIRNEFYPLEGKNHGPHIDKSQHLTNDFYFIQSKIENFFYKELKKNVSIEESTTDPQIYCVNDPNISSINWKVEGGYILNVNGTNVRVVWNRDAKTHKIEVSGLHKNGTSFYSQKSIIIVVA